MVPGYHRPAVVKVNLGAIRRNIKNEMKHLATGQKMLAVVKANAYGHGAVEVAKIAIEEGAAGLCVAILDEALQLRHADIVKPILVLGVVSPEYAPIAAANNVSLTIPNLEWLKEAEKYLEKEQLQLKVHIGVDSGMGRIGFNEDEDFIAANKFLQNNDNFYVEGMFAHFASADSADDTYFKHQVEKFAHMRSLLTVKPKWIHVDNTAASIFNKDVTSDCVRFGKAIQAAGGYSFVSCSDEAVENGFVRLADYPITDLIFGADRRPFSHTLQQLLTTYCQGGGNLMLSGSYIGSNMNSPTALNFTENILKYSFGGSMINSTSGEIYGANTRFSIPRTINEQTYAVPAPDCLTPIAPAYSAFVYNPGSYSAGIAYKGKYRTFVLGFPFESIQGVKERARVMSAILGFFGSK